MSNTHIINRYLIKEVLMTFLGVSLVLLLIFISGQLVNLYGEAVSGGIPPAIVLKLLGLKSLSNLAFITPLSFYIAILLAFSRLYKDNEMVVLAACGISLWAVLRSVLSLAGLFAIIVSGLSLYMVPWAESTSDLMIKKHESANRVEALSSGRFRELTHGEGVVYVQEFDQSELKMKNVFLQHREEKKNSIVSAESGHKEVDKKTGDNFIILEHGQRYEGPMEDGSTAIIQFKHHGIRLEEKPIKEFTFRKKAETSLALWERGKVDDYAELQWRISTAISCLVLAVLAVPLSKTSPRQGRYSKLAIALLIYIIYSNLLSVSNAWLSKGILDVWVGLWWVHLVAILLALSFYIHWRPLLRRFWYGKR
ncbi:MAG: LPS export ABC transporter permease LptF [Thioalkalispiraceae bacterium]|jgi:lipopolysaccharide export system permease protein